MIKSIEKINYIDHRIEYLTNYIKELEKYKLKCDVERQKEVIKIYESIKYDLEVLKILIKLLKIHEVSHFIEGKIINKLYLDITDYTFKELQIIKDYLESNKVGDSHD